MKLCGNCDFYASCSNYAECCKDYRSSKTNFDCCCESIENMAQAIDIMKVGWTKEQITEWLKQKREGRNE